MPCRTIVIVAMRVRRGIAMAMMVDVRCHTRSFAQGLIKVGRVVVLVVLVVRKFGETRFVAFRLAGPRNV